MTDRHNRHDVKHSGTRRVAVAFGLGLLLVAAPAAAQLNVNITGRVTPGTPNYRPNTVQGLSLDPAGNVRVAPAEPVYVAPAPAAAPPILSGTQLGNPLLFRAGIAAYCRQNLAGCGPPIGGR